MTLLSAVWLIFSATVRNRLLRQLQRLRQPRYLVSTFAGLAYFWWFVARRVSWLSTAENGPPVRFVHAGVPILTGLALLVILGAWFFGDERAQLAFSEAEVQFLFPAPLGRRTLVHYKLLRGFVNLAFGALIWSLFFGRALSESPGLFVAGSWLGLTLIYLHRIAATFTRAKLVDRGRAGKALYWALFAAAVGALVAAAYQTFSHRAGAFTEEGPFEWVSKTLATPPLGWALWPIRAVVRLATAASPSGFARALPAVVGLLLLHYLWVMATVAPFEEASMEAAEVRSRMLETRRSRGPFATAIKKRRAPFQLTGVGNPALAIAWKNAVAAVRRIDVWPILSLVLVMVVGAFAAGGALQKGSTVLALVQVACAVGAAMLMVLGPLLLRVDLRDDGARLEVLKAWPLSGRQLVLSELASPAVILGALEGVLGAAALALPFPEYPLEADQRAALALGFVLLAPFVSLVGLTFYNGMAVLFPGWTALRERRRGFEAMGQRLIAMAGNVFVLAVGLLPALVIAGGVAFALWWAIGWAALPIGAAVVAGALAVEVYLAAIALGRMLDSHDVSQ